LLSSEIDLIYCAGNILFDYYALEAGFHLGIRSNKTSYFPVIFVDNDFKNIDFEHHLDRVKLENRYAQRCGYDGLKYVTVPDLSDNEFSLYDIERCLEQAEILAQYSKYVIVIPKLLEQIAFIPHKYIIGISVPSKYGSLNFNLSDAKELSNYKVHLLGGGPSKQLQFGKILKQLGSEVISIDNNAIEKVSSFGDYWDGTKWTRLPVEDKFRHECFKKSLEGLKLSWS
jgi:hypothetical protein